MPVQSGRARSIPSLDGLRAVSILLVVVGHLLSSAQVQAIGGPRLKLDLGAMGVRVFFVISGFLITRLLLAESEDSRGINLGRFYFRRTLRIFPPYYTYLLVLFILCIVDVVHLGVRDVVHSLTYTTNYYFARSWEIGHTWSLAVEEQFYLMWPALLLALGRSRAFKATVLFVLLAPLLRLAIWTWIPAYGVGVGHTFETVSDAIGIGCLVAISWQRLESSRTKRWLLQRWLVVVAIALLPLCASVTDHPRVFAIAATVMNLAIAYILVYFVSRPTGLGGRFLNLAPIRYLGVLSYSVYLWQQLFLDPENIEMYTSLPLNIVLLVVSSLLSYYLVERPSLRVRHRLERWLERRRTIQAAA